VFFAKHDMAALALSMPVRAVWEDRSSLASEFNGGGFDAVQWRKASSNSVLTSDRPMPHL